MKPAAPKPASGASTLPAGSGIVDADHALGDAAVAAAEAAVDAVEAKTTYLTTDYSQRYGPVGRFLDLTAAEAAEGLVDRRTPAQIEAQGPNGAPDTVLIVPSEDQLKRRR